MGNGPSKETLTEKNLSDQSGKVFIVTGGTTGVGLDLSKILYAHNAKVYIAARSAEKAKDAIESIKKAHPDSKGDLIFQSLHLDDLTTIKASAEEFLSKEQRLDILWNNAGVMIPPQGSKTKQGYELQLGTNNVGHQLFTKFLTPLLVETAKTAPAESVRVVWVASSAAKAFSPPGGVNMENLDYKNDKYAFHKYGVSKAGNILQGAEFARRYGDTGVISVSCDPGNLKTPLYRHVPGFVSTFLNTFILHDPIYGAYTELYCGLSPDIKKEKNGTFFIPWGKSAAARKDIEAAMKLEGEGDGTGNAKNFWDWVEKETAQYS